MRLLHTSDWHLGKRLFDKERYDVFEKFLAWLLSTIRQERKIYILSNQSLYSLHQTD